MANDKPVEFISQEPCNDYPTRGQIETMLKYYWTTDKQYKFDIEELIQQEGTPYFPGTTIAKTADDEFYIRRQYNVYKNLVSGIQQGGSKRKRNKE
jgi:hypothetical protein